MTHSTIKFDCSLKRGPSVDGAEVIETWEHRTGEWKNGNNTHGLGLQLLVFLHTNHLLR